MIQSTTKKTWRDGCRRVLWKEHCTSPKWVGPGYTVFSVPTSAYSKHFHAWLQIGKPGKLWTATAPTSTPFPPKPNHNIESWHMIRTKKKSMHNA